LSQQSWQLPSPQQASVQPQWESRQQLWQVLSPQQWRELGQSLSSQHSRHRPPQQAPPDVQSLSVQHSEHAPSQHASPPEQ
jgi:hypothetical protein